MIDQFIKPIAFCYYLLMRFKERRLGYRLRFDNLSNHWILGTMISDMDFVWKRFSISARGINFFTIGKIEKGISTRFIPTSPYFQSWLGGYIVRFTDRREWTAKDHFKLAEADQKEWLSFYGDNEMFVETVDSKLLGKVDLGDFQGDLYYGKIMSDIEVGDKKPVLLPFTLAVITSIMSKRSFGQKVSYKNLLPQYTKDFPLNPFQKVLLEGYIIIISLDSKTKAVIYANACSFTDKNNQKHDHFSVIKDELLEQIKSIAIEKIM